MTSVQAELRSARLFTELNTVMSYALNARECGCSVIPLKGGRNRVTGKQPQVTWQAYQTQRASAEQIEEWFRRGTSAYGVVCGQVSRLIVIDFDEQHAQAKFIEKFPHLMDTYIVKSGGRGTLHFYFEVDFTVRTTKIRGGDLKAEGSYVVGAGSQIGGGRWAVFNDLPLKRISQQELDGILSVFGIVRPQSIQHTNDGDVKIVSSPDYFISLYHSFVQQFNGRNEALFRVGCMMRDEGYNSDTVTAVLSQAHIQHPPVTQHKSESTLQRQKESHLTLRSVFKRPARRKSSTIRKSAQASYVPNHLREAILQYRDGTAFLRVYEGLMLAGKSAGQTVTEQEVLNFLSSYGIGRPSVRKALKFTITPFPGTHPHAVADLAQAESHTNTCVFVPTTKGDKIRGRPATHYVIPTIEQLCDLCKVESIGADPITLADILSVRTYRSALNRELIRRRSGKYSQAWLAKRIGVTARTIQRYVRIEGIQGSQVLHETQLDWNNVDYIPTPAQARRAGFSIQPYFLQEANGKRYPPKASIARKLLKQKIRVSLFRRDCNVYWYAHEMICSTVEQPDIKTANQPKLFPLHQYPDTKTISMPSEDMPITVPDVNDTDYEVETRNDSKDIKLDRRSTRFYNRPLSNSADEWLAQKVNRSAHNLQEVEARHLVDLYGKQAVGRALGRLEYFREQGRLRNPAGFMKVASRVAWKTIHQDDAPDYHAPQKRKGRLIMYKSLKHDPLFRSKAYLEWRVGFLGEDVWEYPSLIDVIRF